MRKIGLFLLAAFLGAIPVVVIAQVYNKFGPASGVLKGSTSTYQTTAATSADVLSLWSGSCSSSTFLRGDGSCQSAGGGGSPGGADTNIQYNSSGSFGGSASFTWDNGGRQLSIDTFSGQTNPALRLRSAAGVAGVTMDLDDVVASGAYGGLAFNNNHLTLGALDGTGGLQGFGLDMVVVGNNINSSQLKANGSHSLGINNSGGIIVNGSTGSSGQILGIGGWQDPYFSVQVSSLGGGALIAGACDSNSASLTGVSAGMAVVATPNTYPGDGFYWYGYVSSTNNVTVKICSVIGGTPTASTYEVRVLQ